MNPTPWPAAQITGGQLHVIQTEARNQRVPLYKHRRELLGHIAWMAGEIDQLRTDLADGDRKYRHLATAAQADQEATAEAMAAADREIAALRTQLAAVHDDPAADLPGTVRIGPKGTVCVCASAGINKGWRAIGSSMLLDHEDVVGWTRGTPVEGTPAAKAADQ